MVRTMARTIIATAPAKAILLGEHAVNRGQMALAVSVGLYSTCTLILPEEEEQAKEQPHCSQAGVSEAHDSYSFVSECKGDGQTRHTATTTRQAILDFGLTIDKLRAHNNHAALQKIAASDFFAPARYVLAALGDALPPRLHISCASEIPQSAGLGSGGSTFVALAAALARLCGQTYKARQLAAWALRGDIIAHGGTASGLDTQTSLYGGAIRYTAEAQGEPIPCADGLMLVIGNSHVFAATSQVNGRVRAWLSEHPVRLHYFQEIGFLAKHAEVALRTGSWADLGHMLNLNQLLLERIGVSCPELERLIDAALGAGALGAKLSGSGGGGIMIALVSAETASEVAQAIIDAGGAAIVAPVGVPGVVVAEP